VKTGEYDIKKFLVLSLLVMYLFIALTYLFYLPKFNSLLLTTHYPQINSHLVLNPVHYVDHSSNNGIVLLHGVYKSTVENKREAQNKFSQTAIILTSFLIGSILLLNLLQKTGSHFKLFIHSHQYAYLSYCSLRI
jgi:hypothetical protein